MARYLAVLVYRMLTKGEAWVDQGAARYEQRRDQWEMASLTKHAAAKGFKLVPLGSDLPDQTFPDQTHFTHAAKTSLSRPGPNVCSSIRHRPSAGPRSPNAASVVPSSGDDSGGIRGTSFWRALGRTDTLGLEKEAFS